MNVPKDVQKRIILPLPHNMDDATSVERDGVVVVPGVIDVSFLATPSELFIVLRGM